LPYLKTSAKYSSLFRSLSNVCVMFSLLLGWVGSLSFSMRQRTWAKSWQIKLVESPEGMKQLGRENWHWPCTASVRHRISGQPHGLTLYSPVAVVAGTIIPKFATRDKRLMPRNTDVDADAELSRLRLMVRQWKIEAAQKGRDLHLPVMPFLLRNIWTGALIFFALLMFSTFFITTTTQVCAFTILLSSYSYCTGFHLHCCPRSLLGSYSLGAVHHHNGGETVVIFCWDPF